MYIIYLYSPLLHVSHDDMINNLICCFILYFFLADGPHNIPDGIFKPQTIP